MFNQTFFAAMAPTWAEQLPLKHALTYWIDACQRSVLTLDVLRERGNVYAEHAKSGKPPVLVFDFETVMDARDFDLPANYALVRITPPPEMPTDPAKRPFVVIDPRAGHGPGIGGFKPDSEIGIALQAGHPCYFFSFFPEPMPGQTIEAVARAELKFLEHVGALHPDANAKPFVIGNCQGGWALMLLAAAQPEAVGPILLAGAPVSYWAGVEGKHPMRYSGGLMGGSWLASLTGDLGNGKFDGAHLVSNFEKLNPANTYWSKLYNLYAQVDTERERFLDFERWWGGHYLMNKAEMDWIVQNLFVGNRLARGGVQTADGAVQIDLRKIRAPIIVFASWGDNITPPQQALNWIADLYADASEIRANEQTIVYCLHEKVGHLGIFVSAGVAKKETTEIAAALDLIDMLPPGLYEMTIEDTAPGMSHLELTDGRYLSTFHPREVSDILALDDGREDEEAFDVARRVAEINQANYDKFLSPVVRAVANEPSAKLARKLNPARMERWLVSDKNPALWPVKAVANAVRQQRRPVAPDNPFVLAEQAGSAWIEQTLNSYRDARDAVQEQLFLSIYNSPLLAAALPGAEPEHERAAQPIDTQLSDTACIEQGSALDAGMRMLIHIASDGSGIDERPLRMMQQLLQEAHAAGETSLTLADLKRSAKTQQRALLLDRKRALAALPRLLPEPNQARSAFALVQRIANAQGPLSEAHAQRLAEIELALNLAPLTASAAATGAQDHE
ncbi:DUF3141 domain-containing protein [Paucibacter sp. B2R-40]|uniref:DUF3141 domain-containing protein n=1 Tax=Paucibacter sp. B2R-40 TaxID=2893554 RepID=UPI0021E4019A|nr:DUF3141 domain-containing protein [Paucibacter sp. B2R-40]MCV2353073.1 DUF3141 domain-containing protein [Paucibacter sp. B2R-40]